MKKKIIIALIAYLCCKINVLASEATLKIHSHTPVYFHVSKINTNEINCSYIYEYEINMDEDCYILTNDSTIFIDGERREIINNSEAIQNIKEDTIISAFFESDLNDVETSGINSETKLVVYNISNNLIIDDFISPRYYSDTSQFSFYNSSLDKRRFFVSSNNVYDANSNQYDVDSIVLWKDEFPNEIIGEDAYNIYTKNDFVGVYWVDGSYQVEKAFLIELEKKDEVVYGEEEQLPKIKLGSKSIYYIAGSVIALIVLGIYSIMKINKKV